MCLFIDAAVIDCCDICKRIAIQQTRAFTSLLDYSRCRWIRIAIELSRIDNFNVYRTRGNHQIAFRVMEFIVAGQASSHNCIRYSNGLRISSHIAGTGNTGISKISFGRNLRNGIPIDQARVRILIRCRYGEMIGVLFAVLIDSGTIFLSIDTGFIIFDKIDRTLRYFDIPSHFGDVIVLPTVAIIDGYCIRRY